ncbi:putative bifunctional diguanylate cyclase/phosphodiesterase [Methylobacterium planeticum]|uniref:EAL domain-containing protein n=1 Tax=Methylobacterium planeticum TaxID=2615211 RepID=A0A6N6MXJ9_9HYPH|nr:bifunctional diguanylate cyclase/phosphodiesterase [Methylobacterium planeticum]KAB1076179.1 EAL domain-containing protein [Methylobacterium planeticum]
MQPNSLSTIGGEFADPLREAAFQAERLPETLRHARLLFGLAAILNFLFLASDWRFAGDPHFVVAVPARLGVVVVSLLCLGLAPRAQNFPWLQRLILGWEMATAVCVALLVSSRSDIALFVVLMLPAIFLLVVPTSFRWTVMVGVGTSGLLLAGYALPPPLPATSIGLGLAAVMANVALLLVVVRSNRLRRLEWIAMQAERRANQELQDSRQLFEALFKAVPIPVVVSDQRDGRFVNMNDAARSFFEIGTPGDLEVLSTRDLIGIAERKRVQAELDRHATVRDIEIALRTVEGDRRDVLLSADSVQIGSRPCVITSLVDITSRKAAEEMIRDAAHHDVLTGLPNRALFQATLDASLARAEREQSHIGLILLDLDAFKEVNDTLGHDAGDMLLKEVAQRLSTLVGPGDLVARLGGDEFVLILAGDSGTREQSQRIHAVAAAIPDVLAPAVAIGGRSVSPRASLGLSLYPEHARNAADLLTNADLALYAAKAAGRNQAALFKPALRANIEERVTIAREIRTALEEGGIVPFYQPKVNLDTGAIVGFEALARWHHPARGLLAPAAFASAFDDPEIGAALGTRIAQQVALDLRSWLTSGLDPGRIFVNLSTAQFVERDLAETFLTMLEASGLPTARLGVEVTETVLLGGRGERVAEVLERLHAAGIRVALDDFGTGYASLTHLKRFPVDEIKVDRSFVNDLTRDVNDAAIVTAVLQLGRSLGLDVTAEGVETVEQARFLQAGGCTFAQGYLYAKPIASSRIPRLLQKGVGALATPSAEFADLAAAG